MGATTNQRGVQADGEHRPVAFAVMMMLKQIPANAPVRGIAINGETGVVVIETWDEKLEQLHVFRNLSVIPE